jgi:hypothetical protein
VFKEEQMCNGVPRSCICNEAIAIKKELFVAKTPSNRKEITIPQEELQEVPPYNL